MKLATLLESQLNRLFIVAIGLGAVVLFISTYVSNQQVQEKATHFIASHVRDTSFAEVNAQTVSQIDREVHRLYSAWSSTEDIALTVEVLLDDRLVAKAGTHPQFDLLSSTTSQSYNLPGGERLTVTVVIDLLNQIVFEISLLILFCGFLGGGFLLIRRKLRAIIKEVAQPLEERVNWLSEAAVKLPESIKAEHTFISSRVSEIQALDKSLKIFTNQILALDDRVARTNFDKGLVNMAERLAHSIKGAIGSLRLRIDNADSLNDADREKIISSVNDISAASKNLLKTKRDDEELPQNIKSQIELSGLLKKVIALKKESIPQDKKIAFDLMSELQEESILNANSHEIEEAFSNIIDNSVEAIADSGLIKIALNRNGDNVIVTISDNGCGISEDTIPKLMQKHVTFKVDGNGLGLYHARQTVDELGGSIQISSMLTKGTEVKIEIPLFKEKKAQPLTISISPKQKLVIVDDDRNIHAAVGIVLGEKNKEVIHLNSVSEFEAWMNENRSDAINEHVYWMDYDLKHDSLNGMDLIEKYGLQFESYLITGMASDAEIKSKAKEKNIRLHSKDEVPTIKFQESESEFIPQEMGLEA